jgi:hypothetical protein
MLLIVAATALVAGLVVPGVHTRVPGVHTRVPGVRMTVDTTPEECLADAPSSGAASACGIEDPAGMLQRYLQLLTVLAGEPMADRAVEALVSFAEESVQPLVLDQTKLDQLQGDWQLVWQQNAKTATRSQKALSPLPQFSNFIEDEKGRAVFRNLVSVSGRVQVIADVEYRAPTGTDDEPTNRLGSTICAAGLTLQLGRRFGWRPLRLPLPLRGEGWLDVTYLSDEMRITRGNRGGLFVHLRREFAGCLEQDAPTSPFTISSDRTLLFDSRLRQRGS